MLIMFFIPILFLLDLLGSEGNLIMYIVFNVYKCFFLFTDISHYFRI